MRHTTSKITSTIVFLTFVMIFQGTHAQPSADKNTENAVNPQISILGTFHFGTTGDVAAVKVDDIMSKQRQKEIRQMLKKIKAYKPTKVLVEVVRHKNEAYNQKYRKYLNGDFELGKSEIYQLGFRMAKMMNHDSIYAIDYTLRQPFGEIQEFAEKHGMGDRFKSFVNSVRERAKEKSEYIANHTLMDYYRQLNTDTADRWNRSLYLQETLDYNHDTTYTGPKIAAMHYKRNLYITANVMRHAQPGERLLLIIGSGHRAVMKHFFKTRKDIDYVEVNQFLE